MHKDAQYLEKTVISQVDAAISNCVEKVLFPVKSELILDFYSSNTL